MSTDDEHEDNDEINIEICGKICDSGGTVPTHHNFKIKYLEVLTH